MDREDLREVKCELLESYDNFNAKTLAKMHPDNEAMIYTDKIVEEFTGFFHRYYEKDDILQAVIEKENGEVVFLRLTEDGNNLSTEPVKRWRMTFLNKVPAVRL